MSLFFQKNTREDKPVILIVEKDDTQSAITATIINKSGQYRALTASSRNHAFEVLGHHRRGFDFLTNSISCILLDWDMPESEGQEFLGQLRDDENKSPFKRHIPVIVMSKDETLDTNIGTDHFLHGQASANLLRPIERTELLLILQRIVFEKEAEILRELLVEKQLRLTSRHSKNH